MKLVDDDKTLVYYRFSKKMLDHNVCHILPQLSQGDTVLSADFEAAHTDNSRTASVINDGFSGESKSFQSTLCGSCIPY